MCVCVYVCMCVCVYGYMYACTHACMYAWPLVGTAFETHQAPELSNPKSGSSSTARRHLRCVPVAERACTHPHSASVILLHERITKNHKQAPWHSHAHTRAHAPHAYAHMWTKSASQAERVPRMAVLTFRAAGAFAGAQTRATAKETPARTR